MMKNLPAILTLCVALPWLSHTTLAATEARLDTKLL